MIAVLFTCACAWGVLVGATPTRVTFYVKHQPQHIETLKSVFKIVSDPSSADWGAFLTFDEVVRLQTPFKGHTSLVLEHARLLGPLSVDITAAGDKVVVLLESENVLALGGPAFLATIPKTLQNVVDFVSVSSFSPSSSSSAARSRKSWPAKEKTGQRVSKDPQDCLFDRVDPKCLRDAYGIQLVANATDFNAQTVVVNQGFRASDLTAFLKRGGMPDQKVVKTIGVNTGVAGDEATLDIQFIITTGQLVPTWWVYIDGHVANPFDSWLTWASNTTQIPYVHSLSVGEPEADIARDNGGEVFIARMNNEMMALGARGVSLVFASGDSGFTEIQKYPASSPYVTSVGGVTWGAVFKGPRIAVDEETTGGFSSMTSNTAQDWQKAAVSNFIHNTTGARPLANIKPERRCVPDLSAYSTGFYIVQDGNDQVIGGTSAACPVVAGMLSMINDALIQQKLTPLGFANPFLYANADAFMDIVDGGNNGYDAVKGYDPASGLGTFSPTTFNTLRQRALKQRLALRQRRETGAN